MALIVECPIKGTWLVYDTPLPGWETKTSNSVAVHQYHWGIRCEKCGSNKDTSNPDCIHIRMVRTFKANNQYADKT